MFAYDAQWRDFKLRDQTAVYWALTPYTLWFSPNPFTKETIETEAALYESSVISPVRWHCEGCTALIEDTQTDGNIYLSVFSDDKRLTDPELLALLEDS